MTLQGKKRIGSYGEHLAADFLVQRGCKILHKNFKLKFGEIDLIAQDRDTVCFVEVRSKTTDQVGTPLESITYSKQRKLSRLALAYLQNKHQSMDVKCRFDVVSICFEGEEKYSIEVMQNAFDFCK